MEPKLVRTTYGKVLATSPPNHRYRIGVIGKDEADALQLWREAERQWFELGMRGAEARFNEGCACGFPVPPCSACGPLSSGRPWWIEVP